MTDRVLTARLASIPAVIAAVGRALAPPVVRLALALPFLRSGITKWDGFLSLSPGAEYLFEEQFKLHLFGAAYDFPAPDKLAFVVGCAEIVLPILLLLGLGTRLAAFGLLFMTAVIQLVAPDGWVNFHLYWAALALAAMALGGGAVSLDHLLARRPFAGVRPPDAVRKGLS